MHLGKGGRTAARASEADLLACLRAHEADVTALYLVGDVFDEYIEYRHLIPRGYARFQGLLAAWTDRGIPVTYLVGNHDPWHRTYFREELGVRVVFDSVVEPLEGVNVYVAHGDGLTEANPVYNRLRPLLRHPLPVWLYRNMLPGDAGLGLAKWAKHMIGKDTVDERAVAAFRRYARDLLAADVADVVVLGHTHRAELTSWPHGTYLNTGYWHESRTFGRLDPDGVQLLRWNGTHAALVEPDAPREPDRAVPDPASTDSL